MNARMRRRFAQLSLLLALLLLVGCVSQPFTDPASPYFRVPEGSRVTINRVLEIPPGQARLFMQNGRVMENFDHYIPNCNIEVRKLDREAVQFVRPDSYRVVRTQRTLQENVRAGRLLVASAGGVLALSDDSAGTAMVYEGYHLWLAGPDPNVMRVSCRGVFASQNEAFPPSLDEMRQALGSLMTIEVAGGVP